MNSTTARLSLLALIATVLSFGLQAAAPDTAADPATPSGEQAATDQAPADLPLAVPGNNAAGTGNTLPDVERSAVPPDDVIVHFGGDSFLAAGKRATGVIAIVGSSTSDGEVGDAVISVLGNTRMRGASDSAIAVFGDTYVDGHVREDAVAVFGNVELGPNAQIDGDVVAIGGVIKRDAAAVIRGGSEQVSFPMQFGDMEWLRPWLKHCLLYGRLLGLEPGLGWAWSLAFGFLGLYVLLALLFSGSVEKCVATLETRPGQSLLASLLTMLLTPVLMVLLAITVIGIAIIPALWTALLCVGMFGKVVILAALGRRLTRFISAGPLSHIAFPVLVGGLLLIGVYLVPVLGIIAYKLSGILGLGVVVYTVLLAVRAHRAQAAVQADPLEAAAIPPSLVPPITELPPAGELHPASDARTLPRAGFWIRMCALLIDAILISIIVASFHSNGAWLPLLAAYGAVMWKLRGTTVGGIVCNLQVVRIDGREIDWATSIVRALSCFLSMFAAGLGFLWIALDDDRQAWHDKIAGTAVVLVPRGRSLI